MTPQRLATPLHSLQPILHIIYPRSILSYSKGAQGLFVPLRVNGIFTVTTISPSSWLRQCPVTISQLFPSHDTPHHLIFQHRAGVTPYTSTFVLAQSCVFVKQSQPPILCDLYQLRTRSPTPTEAHLLPKLRCQFAEFLLLSSLKRLRILILPTCVGLRYGSYAAEA